MKIPLVNQKGFGLLEALLIIIAVSIIGFGGYYVYTNQKDDSESATSISDVSRNTGDKSSDGKTEQKMVVGSRSIVLSHLPGWKYASMEATDWYESEGQLVAPGGDVVISMRAVGPDAGFGGECVPEENGKIVQIDHYDTQQEGFYTTVVMVKELNGTYTYNAWVSDDSTARSLRVGSSNCDTWYTNHLLRDYGEGVAFINIESLTMKDKNSYPNGFTQSQIEGLFGTRDFRGALEILKTLRVE